MDDTEQILQQKEDLLKRLKTAGTSAAMPDDPCIIALFTAAAKGHYDYCHLLLRY